MIVFLIKRLANAALVMLVVALMAFMIFRFVGDPIQLMVNEQTTQVERDALRERLGLNESVVMQYLRFVGNAVQGDFGISYRNQQEVMSLIAERFPALCKAGSPDEVNEIYSVALKGIPLIAVNRVPAALPVRLENQYFALDMESAAARDMLEQGVCMFYVPSLLGALELELFAVLRS